MRATLGVRPGRKARGTMVPPRRAPSECDGVPREIVPELTGPIVSLMAAPSRTLVYVGRRR